MILFNYRFIDEAYLQAQHLENIGQKKGQLRSQNKKRDKMLPRRVRISEGKGEEDYRQDT